MAPLTDLLRDKVKFVWSPLCQSAFQQVKMLLCTAPVLAAPRLDRSFKLYVDAFLYLFLCSFMVPRCCDLIVMVL